MRDWTPPAGTACPPTPTATPPARPCWWRPDGRDGVATRFLSDAERASLETWPAEISHTDLVAHFTLDVADVRWLARQRSPANRLGLSVQLTGLRYLLSLIHISEPTRLGMIS